MDALCPYNGVKGSGRMANLLIVSHGNLAKEMTATARMIMGDFEGVHVLGLQADDHIETFYEKIKKECEQASEGLLILTDLAGGSPFIQASRCYYDMFERKTIEVVTGTNLAIVIECISQRAYKNVHELKDLALSVGAGSIKSFEINKEVK